MSREKVKKQALPAIVDLPPLLRWRLVLGEAGQAGLGSPRAPAEVLAADEALAWLYGRDPDLASRDVLSRQGGRCPSTLTVPEWIDAVHELFPKEVVERLEQDAVERYQIEEVVTNPDVSPYEGMSMFPQPILERRS